MSRFYMYDSQTNSYAPVAEFATSYNADSRSSSRYRGQEGGRRPRPDVKGKNGKMTPGALSTAELRVTGSGQNPIGRASRNLTKGGGLALNDPGMRYTNANAQAFKNMTTKKLNGKLLLGGAGLLGAGALVGGGILANKKRKEAAKSPLRKRYESLRNRMGR